MGPHSWRGRGESLRDRLLRAGPQGLVCLPPSADHPCPLFFPKLALSAPPIVPPSRMMATPSSQLLRPQALESSLPPLSLSHPPSNPSGFPVGSVFKYRRSSAISHDVHCHHPGQVTIIPPLDYCHGVPILLPASSPLPLPPSHHTVTSCHSSIQSPAMSPHFILNKSPCFPKAAPLLPHASGLSSLVLAFPTYSTVAQVCQAHADHRTLALPFQPLLGMFCSCLPGSCQFPSILLRRCLSGPTLVSLVKVTIYTSPSCCVWALLTPSLFPFSSWYTSPSAMI